METQVYFVLKVAFHHGNIRFDAQANDPCRTFQDGTDEDNQVNSCDDILHDVLGLSVRGSFHLRGNEELDGFCEQDVVRWPYSGTDH